MMMTTLYFCVTLPRPKLHYRNSTFETSSWNIGMFQVTDEGPEQPKKKKTRSTSFERRMNERNLRMTALHANKPAALPIRHANNNNDTGNSNNNSFRRFENSTWWAAPIQPNPRFQHCLNRPPPPPCTSSPPRLIQPATFTLPPPTFFPTLQPPSFLSYNHVFPPSVPPFDPNRPPPPFGFPPPMPPQMPFHRPPPWPCWWLRLYQQAH